MSTTRVAVAGTFGPLHDGHRNLLRTALRYGDRSVVVGVTTDEFAQARRTREVPPFENRRAVLETTLAEIDDWNRQVELRELNHEYGIVSEEAEIDALTVSPETASELTAINERRRKRGFEPLEGVVAPYVLAEDGKRISSTRIARGEIDEHGRLR